MTSSIIKNGKLPIVPASAGFRSSLSIVRALESCSFTPCCLVSLRPFYDTVVRWFRASSGEHYADTQIMKVNLRTEKLISHCT